VEAVTEGIDWIDRAAARAKGKRPAYLETPEQDRTLSIVLALAAEVSALRERLDTVERLLDQRGTISRHDIETYTPDPVAGKERGILVKAYIARVMRGVTQEMEAMATLEPSVEQVSRELRDL
jgi:hypothetical protein